MKVKIEIDHPHFGEIEYNSEGLPVCHICGRAFKKPLSHVWQSHGISAGEYKRMFGLDVNKGIVCEETRDRLRESVEKHYDKVVINNLLKNGQKSRFRSGGQGRTRDMVSEQTRRNMTERINKRYSVR